MTTAGIQRLIDDSLEPRIEIGGPTPEGYSFLAQLGLHLPDHYMLTNCANPIVLNPFGDDAKEHVVEQVVVIRTLPYKDNSIGMFLTSSLPLQGGYVQTFKQVALGEYCRASSLSGKLPELHNLHTVLLRQALRALRQGGLIIMENTWTQDTGIAQKLGFIPLLAEATELQLHSQIYIKP